MPASCSVEIVLQRDRRTHGLRYGIYRLFRLLRTPEIGMQDSPRQVNHRAQRALPFLNQPLFQLLLPRHAPGGQGIFCLNMAPGLVLKQT